MELLGSKRIRSTAYHPSANGLIERFHHQLKASLKAQLQPTLWVDAFPLVLLGIRTALKEDICCSAAELVYGTTLHLAGEFFDSDHSLPLADPAEYVAQLKATMAKLRAPPIRKQSPKKTYVSNDLASSLVPRPNFPNGLQHFEWAKWAWERGYLSSCTHVYIRHDGTRKPLQRSYDGPYKVLKRDDKHFTVEVKGQQDTVSLDPLKPAHLEPSLTASETSTTTLTEPTEPFSPPVSTPSQTNPVPTSVTTRSGCRVHWPKCYL